MLLYAIDANLTIMRTHKHMKPRISALWERHVRAMIYQLITVDENVKSAHHYPVHIEVLSILVYTNKSTC